MTTAQLPVVDAWRAKSAKPGIPRSLAAAGLAIRVTIASRLIVWGGALGAIALFGGGAAERATNDPAGSTRPFGSAVANLLFAPTARWDSTWYLQIAHAGYFSRASSTFFPVYPLLIRFGSMVFGSEIVVGALISIVSMAVALHLLYRLTRLDMGEPAARNTVLLLALFPTAFFLSAVYTEALFLLLSLGAVYAARQDRWALAGLAGALASATRVNGILLLVPLAFMYLYGPRPSAVRRATAEWWRPRYPLRGSAFWLFAVPLGLIVYLGYLWVAHDAPLAPFEVQATVWAHQYAGPFGAIVTLLLRLPHDVGLIGAGHGGIAGPGDPLTFQAHDLIDLGFLAFAVAGLVFSWRRVAPALFIYGLVYLASVLSEPTQMEALQGISRYLLVAFPLFMGWGGWLAERRLPRHVTFGVSALLLVVFSGLWGTWAWIG